jgi:hypothetical protein
VLRPRELVEAEGDARLAHLEADQVAPGVGDVRVLDAEDEGGLAADSRELVERVGAVFGGSGRRGVGRRVRAQGARVDVRGEVAD